MAYFDENGRITIDEDAAAKDIKRLRESAQVLKDSRAAIRSMKNQALEFKGEMSNAIVEKANEMERRQTAMIEKLEETAAYIQRVVNRYQKLDEEIKKAIQAAASAAEAAAKAASVAAGTAGAIAGGSTVAKSSSGKTYGGGGNGRGSGGGSHGSSSGKTSKKNDDLMDKVKDAMDDVGDFLKGLF